MTLEQNEIHHSRLLQIQDGFSRIFSQIGATTKFEIIRNKWNLLIASVASVFVYLLLLTINLIQEARGVEAATQLDYLLSYFTLGFFTLINFLIVVIAVIFAGSIISEDYQKDTGHLIFPKTTKGRLLTGRIIARYFLAAVSMTVFYLLVGITTLIKYGSLVPEFWASWSWALFYTFLVFSVVTFFSSFMRSNAGTIIVSLLLLIIVFNLLTGILTITGSQVEPLFILTYYANIITECFDMPTDRYVEVGLRPGPGGGDGPTIFSWLTPSITGAAIGMLIYTTLLLTSAYIIFRFRQKK